MIEVARRLSEELRDDELLARYGGDELIWVTAGVEDASALEPLVERLRAKFEKPVCVENTELEVTVSIGSAIYPDDGKNISVLFDATDKIDVQRQAQRFVWSQPFFRDCVEERLFRGRTQPDR